jgi:predicted proteasome-type protease
MTYCCGILVRDGLVMFADTRTNAGVDNISTFRKLHVFVQPGTRIMATATAGNLSISQSVVSMLREGLENPETGEKETLMNAPNVMIWPAETCALMFSRATVPLAFTNVTVSFIKFLMRVMPFPPLATSRSQ